MASPAEAVHDGYRVVVVPPMADLAAAVDHRVFLQQDAAAIVTRRVPDARLGLVAGYGMVTYDRGVCSGAAVVGA